MDGIGSNDPLDGVDLIHLNLFDFYRVNVGKYTLRYGSYI